MITHDLRVLADAILDKKGQNVVSIDLRPIGTAITDYNIICTGNPVRKEFLTVSKEEAREKLGIKPLRTQGMENNFWVILDFGNIVVHIFQKEYRDFYRLEDLWADAPQKTYKERKTSRKEETLE